MLAFGLVDGAQSVSLATTVLDCDTVGAIKRIVRDQEVGAAEALVDDLVEVGIGGHFLARRSTRERSRAGELWRPRRWQREVFEQYAGRSLVAEAAAEADEILATHEVPPLADDVVARGGRRHRALRTDGGRAGRPRALAGGIVRTEPERGRGEPDVAAGAAEVTVAPTDDLDAVRALGVASGLDESERDETGLVGAWAARTADGATGRRHRPRALRRPRRRQLDGGGRRLSRARDRLAPARASSSARRAPAGCGGSTPPRGRRGSSSRTGSFRWTTAPNASTCSATVPRVRSTGASARRRLWRKIWRDDEGGHVARVRLEYLSEADKQSFHEQVMRVLEEVGVAYNTPTLTTLLADAGAIVDAERLTAKLPWALDRALPGPGAGRDPARGARPGVRLHGRRRATCSA